jgi:hypothetical protein
MGHGQNVTAPQRDAVRFNRLKQELGYIIPYLNQGKVGDSGDFDRVWDG